MQHLEAMRQSPRLSTTRRWTRIKIINQINSQCLAKANEEIAAQMAKHNLYTLEHINHEFHNLDLEPTTIAINQVLGQPEEGCEHVMVDDWATCKASSKAEDAALYQARPKGQSVQVREKPRRSK